MLHTFIDHVLVPQGIKVEEHSPFWFAAFGAVFFFVLQFVFAGVLGSVSSVYRNLSWKERQQFRMHAISLFHASLGSLHGVVIFLMDPFVQRPDLMFFPTYDMRAMMAFHLGYFFQDFFVTWWQHSAIGDMATYIHHISVGGAFATCIYTETGMWVTGSLLANEVSGPFLHGRYFIRKYNLGGTVYEQLNSFVLVLSYAVFRLVFTLYHVVNATWYQWYMFDGSSEHVPFRQKIIVEVLLLPLILQFLMNVFWFKKVIKLSEPIVKAAEYLGVMRLKNSRVGKRVQDISQHANQAVETIKESASSHVNSIRNQTVGTLQETVEHVKTAGKSGVEIVLDSQSEKPKSQRAVQLQVAMRFIWWIGGALLFCTDIARRSRNYSQPVEMFSYLVALLLLVLGMFSLVFNEKPVLNNAPAAKVKAQ